MYPHDDSNFTLSVFELSPSGTNRISPKRPQKLPRRINEQNGTVEEASPVAGGLFNSLNKATNTTATACNSTLATSNLFKFVNSRVLPT